MNKLYPDLSKLENTDKVSLSKWTGAYIFIFKSSQISKFNFVYESGW